MAGESQATAGSMKELDALKIYSIDFEDNGALIAFCGGIAPAFRVIDDIKREANGKSLDSEWAAVNLAQKSIKNFHRNVLGLYNLPDMPEDRQRALFERDENFFQLMIAHFYRYKAYLYTIDSITAQAQPCSRFAAIGIASRISKFFLSQIDASRMTWQTGLTLAIDTIEHVKGIDAFCGGPVSVAVVERGRKRTMPFPNHFTERICKKLNAENNQLGVARTQAYERVIADIYKEIDEAFEKSRQAEKQWEEDCSKLREQEDKRSQHNTSQ